MPIIYNTFLARYAYILHFYAIPLPDVDGSGAEPAPTNPVSGPPSSTPSSYGTEMGGNDPRINAFKCSCIGDDSGCNVDAAESVRR